MEAKVIVAQQYTTRTNVQGWTVGITGESKPRMFLRTAKKAMGYMFVLKNQTGLNISDNCLQRLSHEYKVWKEEMNKKKLGEALLQQQDDEIHAKVVAIAAEQKKQRRSKKNSK